MKYERTVGLGVVGILSGHGSVPLGFLDLPVGGDPAGSAGQMGHPARLRSQGLSPPGRVALLLWTQMTLPSPVYSGIEYACAHVRVHICA